MLARSYLALDQYANALLSIEESRAILGRPEPEQQPDWLSSTLRSIDEAGAQASGEALTQALRSLKNAKNAGVAPAIHVRVPFDVGTAELTAAGLTQVEKIGQAIQALSKAGVNRFVLVGHTDSQPWRGLSPEASQQKNQQLSEQRAEAVRRQLSQQDPELNVELQTEGQGQNQPRHSGSDTQAHALNRRVEIKIPKS